MSRRRTLNALVAAASAAVALAGLPAVASAAVDPTGCTPNVAYDPAIPTFKSVTGRDLGQGGTGRGTTGIASGPAASNKTQVLTDYADLLVETTKGYDGNDPAQASKIKAIGFDLGETDTERADRHLKFYVVGTAKNIDNLNAGRKDAEFWQGVRGGTISEADGLAAVNERPAFAWVTATPHGNEPAAGEAIARQMYELLARTDCANQRRVAVLDTFLMLVRNPDGRDNDKRTSAWSFDHNRDFGTMNQIENRKFIPVMNQYPGVFFIDAHQQASGYFFPPNEDPVHHEISTFTRDFIQKDIGPMLQKTFNDQSVQYQNYNSYDLFTPEYGDTVPSLVMGAAGMTYEKGYDEIYGKQVYDHYLAIDKTIDITANQKTRVLHDWVEQWQEAVDQGEKGELQENKLMSPLHTTISNYVGTDRKVFGYYFPADEHEGDTVRMLQELRAVGVHVYKLDEDANVLGQREFGNWQSFAGGAGSLKKGTYYVPMNQPMKHWIQAVLGEDPFVPYPYFYDVATWSYSMLRGLRGSGWLTAKPALKLTEIPAAPFEKLGDIDAGGVTDGGKAVLAFNTDSLQGQLLAIDLLTKGVTVSRAKTAFDAAGRHFYTGAALVDGASASAAGVDLAAASTKRDTKITGLDGYPVTRTVLGKPKIGIYTAATTVPSYPRSNDSNDHICAGTPCEALFATLEKEHIDPSMIVPITSTALAAGDLVTQGITAFINPGGTIAAGAGATALQTFVNGGGRYIGTAAGGITSARNAGITLVNTPTPNLSGITAGGVVMEAKYDAAASPLSWGFDLGGWSYRQSDVNIDPGTLAGNGTTIPPAITAAKYADTGDAHAYGYSVGAVGPGRLDGRPIAIDQPFGSGRALLMNGNPFFRGWKDQDERVVLNGVLYPLGEEIAPAVAVTSKSEVKEAIEPTAAPVAAAKLPAVKNRAIKADTSGNDIKFVVNKRAYGKAFKKAITKAKLPKSVLKKAKLVTGKYTVTLTIKGAHSTDEHKNAIWQGKLLGSFKKYKVKLTSAKL